MERELVVSHRIFLNREQRYTLSVDDTLIEAKGKCLQVWKKDTKTNEPCEDVEQDYIISNVRSLVIIQKLDNKYKISLPNFDARIGLLDPKDGGSKSFHIVYKEIIWIDDKEQNSFHYIIIEDYDDMIKSMVSEPT